MKRLFILLLVLGMVFSFSSCGIVDLSGLVGLSDGKEDESGILDLGQIDLGKIFENQTGGLNDVVYENLSDAEKQALIDEAKEDGVNITFTPDGKMVATDEDGSVMVQNPDGSWAVQGEDGSVGQIGGDWPSNEFTALLPKPDFELFSANTSDTEFSVSFMSASIGQIRAYVERVKAAGFTVDAQTEDQSMMGMVIYSYTASNANGYSIEVFSAMGISGLTLSK